MARRARTWVALVTTTVLVGATTGVTLSAAPASADDLVCSGMSAEQNNRAGNQAPTPRDDTASALAGGTGTIRVLANDSDPEGDDLAVVSVTQPARGEVCIDGDGRIEYFAVGSATGYTDRFRYGVTDGDLFRTATVTVRVRGVRPVAATLVKRKKGSKAAVIRFANPNDRNLAVLAGSPKRKKPQLSRTVGPGKSVGLRTKSKRIVYYALAYDTDGYPILVAIGVINTRTGRVSVQSGEAVLLRQRPGASSVDRPLLRSWMRHR